MEVKRVTERRRERESRKKENAYRFIDIYVVIDVGVWHTSKKTCVWSVKMTCND